MLPSCASDAVPVVGSMFEFEGECYRLDGYLCEVSERPSMGSMIDHILDLVEADENAELDPELRRIKLRWCLPLEATYVCGTGAAGCLAPLASITVTGMVRWENDLLAHHRTQALARGQQGHYVATIIALAI